MPKDVGAAAVSGKRGIWEKYGNVGFSLRHLKRLMPSLRHARELVMLCADDFGF